MRENYYDNIAKKKKAHQKFVHRLFYLFVCLFVCFVPSNRRTNFWKKWQSLARVPNENQIESCKTVWSSPFWFPVQTLKLKIINKFWFLFVATLNMQANFSAAIPRPPTHSNPSSFRHEKFKNCNRVRVTHESRLIQPLTDVYFISYFHLNPLTSISFSSITKAVLFPPFAWTRKKE